MVLSDGNALYSKRKFFLHTTKNRLSDPSKICALDFKHEFRRFAICSVSATIGNDRSTFSRLIENAVDTHQGKKTVSRSDHRCERPAQRSRQWHTPKGILAPVRKCSSWPSPFTRWLATIARRIQAGHCPDWGLASSWATIVMLCHRYNEARCASYSWKMTT